MPTLFASVIFRAPECENVEQLRERYGAPEEITLHGDATLFRTIMHVYGLEHLPGPQHDMFGGGFVFDTLGSDWPTWGAPGTLTCTKKGIPHELFITHVAVIAEAPPELAPPTAEEREEAQSSR